MPKRLLWPVLLAACASTPFPGIEPADHGDAARYVPVARGGTWEQRWIVDRRGTEFAFTLLLRVEPPGAMHFVALNDFGATFAEANESEVLRESRALPAALVVAIRELLRALYLPPGSEAFEPARIRESGEEGAFAAEQQQFWGADDLWSRTGRVQVREWRGEPRWPHRFELTGRITATVESRELV